MVACRSVSSTPPTPSIGIRKLSILKTIAQMRNPELSVPGLLSHIGEKFTERRRLSEEEGHVVQSTGRFRIISNNRLQAQSSLVPNQSHTGMAFQIGASSKPMGCVISSL